MAEPIVAPSDARAVTVRGGDRRSYLDAVLSHRIDDLAEGRWRSALHLDQQGAPVAMVDIAALDDVLLLVAPDAEVQTELVEGMGQRTFLADAAFAALDHDVWSLRGAGAHPALSEVGIGDVQAGDATKAGEVVVLVREDGADLIGPTSAVTALADRLEDSGAARVDAGTLDAYRIAHGEPRWGREIAKPHLPEELGLLPTHVHLDKGCYPGQEAVARMWMLGRPRRRLAVVEVDDGIEAGWEHGSGRQTVRLTAVATWNDRRRGLAFVPSDATAGDRYGDDAGVRVLEIVGQGRDIAGHHPSVRRRRDQRAQAR